MLTTPVVPGTKIATTPNAANEHAEHVLPGFVSSPSGLFVPYTGDAANGLDVDVTRIGGLVSNRTWGTFWNNRGRRFLATTGYIPLTQNVVAPMAMAENPAGSGYWMFFDVLEFGAFGATSRFSRYGGVTITSRGTAQTVGSTGGFTQTAGAITDPLTQTASSVFKVYNPGQFAVTVNGSGVPTVGGVAQTPRKVAPMKDAEPYFVNAFGSLILRPGSNVYWSTDEVPGGGSGSYSAYINFEWVEIPEAMAQAILTSTQAQTVG